MLPDLHDSTLLKHSSFLGVKNARSVLRIWGKKDIEIKVAEINATPKMNSRIGKLLLILSRSIMVLKFSAVEFLRSPS